MLSPVAAPRSAASFAPAEARTRTGNWKTWGLGLLLAAVIGGVCQAAPVTLYDSYTGNTSEADSEATDSQYLADQFLTDGSEYALDSVSLYLAGVPTGTVHVDLWSDVSGQPGASLGTFTNPGAFSAGLNTFTAGGLPSLAANAAYWVVLRGASVGASANWYFTDNQGTVSPATQTMGNAFRTSLGGAWQVSSTQPYMMQVSAERTSVPEIDPSGVGSVMALVTSALGLLERRRSRKA